MDEEQKTPESIEKIMIDKAISDAIATGETEFVWMHPMTETAKAYFESKSCKISDKPFDVEPAKRGYLYLITIGE